MDGDKLSAEWYQPTGLMQVVGREGGFSGQNSYEAMSMWEEILKGAAARHRRTSTWAKWEKGKEIKCSI